MKKLFLIALLPSVSFLKAQTIETDRPDQTESTSIVPAGFLQLESGFSYEKFNEEIKNFAHPTVLWRLGLNDNVELRLQTELLSETISGQNSTGLAPIVFGFKAKLIDEQKLVPSVSFVGHLASAKWASPDFQTTYWTPSFRFLFQHSLSPKLNLSYNLGAEWNGETPDATAIYTLATSYAITERLSSFAEFYGFLNQYSSADHRIDSGLTYLVNDDLLIDLSAGLGLSEISPQYFLATGISYRFPLK